MPFVLFCIDGSYRVEWVLCLISMHHSMILLLCIRYCCLLMTHNVNSWNPFVFQSCTTVCDSISPLKLIAWHGTMFIKRQTLSIVKSPSICSVSNVKKCSSSYLMNTRQTQIDALFLFPFVDEFHQTQCFFVSFISSPGNQWFSTLCILFNSTSKCTTFGKHEHGISITKGHTVFKKRHGFWVVLRDTISFHQPNCQRSLCVHFSSCHKNPLSLCIWCFYVFLVRHLCGFWVLWLFWVFCCFWSEKKRKKRRSQREKKKREKRVVFVFCVFGLLEWLLFFFSFLPKTLFLSFSSLSSLCVLPFPSCQQHHSHTDWTWGHEHKVSQHIEPLPFPHSHHHFPFFCLLVSINLSSQHSFTLASPSCVMWKNTWCLCRLGFTNTQHTGMDGMGDNICTALPQHTITTLSLSHQTPIITPTTKTPLLASHTLMDMKMNKMRMELWKWVTWKHTKQSHPSTLHPSFQPSSITLPFHSFKNTRFMFAVLHNCHCLWLRCEEEKSGDVNHVLFGKDDETTDGGWMTLKKVLMWWTWICGGWWNMERSDYASTRSRLRVQTMPYCSNFATVLRRVSTRLPFSTAS